MLDVQKVKTQPQVAAGDEQFVFQPILRASVLETPSEHSWLKKWASISQLLILLRLVSSGQTSLAASLPRSRRYLKIKRNINSPIQ